jgi:hypothetical protein
VAPREQVLDKRSLNRALLARQLLLERRRASVASTIEHLVGMQAQAPNLPYVGLWARLRDFDTDELSTMVESREAVRLSLMRNTIHVVTRRDAFGVKPLFTRLGERGFMHGSPWGKQFGDGDLKPIAAAGAELMAEKPRTIADLARHLGTRFPGHDSFAMAYGVRYMVPLVFTPPRGTWQGRGLVTLTTFEAWLGRPPGPAITEDELVLRYLRAFGPASVADMRAWSGLSLKAAFDRVRPKLRVFRDEQGRELLDLPRAPRPDPNVEVPVRLLPDYDNILLAHADRSRILPPGKHLGLFSSNGIMKGSVLVDGFVRGSWIPMDESDATVMHVTPFDKQLAKAEAREVEREGRELLKLLAPERRHELRFGPPKI